MKEHVSALYKKRLKLLLKTKLNARNLITAINSWAVAVVRYSASFLDWTKEEMDILDRMTRKALTMNGGAHPKADVDRLYLRRKVGGRGLISVAKCVELERLNLDQYLSNSKDEVFMFISAQRELVADEIETKESYKLRVERETLTAIEDKPLHGQFERDTKDCKNKDLSWMWLANGDMKRETESLIIAAQDQALSTNSIKKSIYKLDVSEKCRLCGKETENVIHIVSSCGMLAQKEYKRRHDKVCQNIHWALCIKFGFEFSQNWWEHKPETTLENDKAKILWDFLFQTDRRIEHRKPDIVVLDKTKNTCLIVDVAIPDDHRIALKEVDKIMNYAELKVELERIWKTKTKIIPVVIGALGSIPKNLGKNLKELDIKHSIQVFQKTALLGTAHILRKVLAV